MIRNSHREFLGWVRDRYGLWTAAKNYPAFVFRRHGVMRYRAGTAPPVFVRPGTADLIVHDEVFLGLCYAVTLPTPPAFIIDAGSHVGLTCVYFARRYPQATIVAIEPEEGNYAVLKLNAAKYPNIHPVHAGLWWRPATLRVKNPAEPTWGFQLEEAAEGLPAVTIPDVLRRFNVGRAALVKMDIEGAEHDLLVQADTWLDMVDNLVIELHDQFRPGCSAALEAAVAGRDFERSVLGNTVSLTRVACQT